MSRSLVALALFGAACTGPDFEPDFTVSPGVETATVLDGAPGEAYTLYDADDNELITLIADDDGQAHFAYLPPEPVTVETGPGASIAYTVAGVLQSGAYEIRGGDGTRSGWFDVLSVDDPGPGTPYDEQVLVGVEQPITGEPSDPMQGFQYLEMRDGVTLSAMIRFPQASIYGDGPYPTVIEYSGYSPSNPWRPDTGTRIANAFGYATVSVNMRGSGCSGGVFDVFNPAQHADGYDVVEIVAAQDWVLGNRVGMVGLSYPGITQLYVASTNPPSLAAVTPLSTIADAWEMQWPGGVYNKGFTQQWVDQREADASAGGEPWVEEIAAEDPICAENIRMSKQNVDFESFLRALDTREPFTDSRDLRQLVQGIEAPVFLAGQFQDEQTGAQFGNMLDRFDSTADLQVLMSNGRHPDGYAPDAVFRWHEFLTFHVAREVPELDPLIRNPIVSDQLAGEFGLSGYRFPDDRFTGMEYDAALEAYLAEPDIEVLLENGAGNATIGAPQPRTSAFFDTWPPPSEPVTWFTAEEGALSDAAPPSEGADVWRHDPDAGEEDFFGPRGYELTVPVWDIDWTRFADGDAVSYVSPPFEEAEVIGGPGVASLWVRSPSEDDLTVQVTLMEVRPDGDESYLQSGWLRLGHRAGAVLDDLRIDRTYAAADFAPVPTGEWVQADVSIPSFAHPMRPGSRLRMVVSSPGRDHGTWLFEAPDYDGIPEFELGRGGDHATSLTLSSYGGFEIAEGYAPCEALRGQPCREYVPMDNVIAE